MPGFISARRLPVKHSAVFFACVCLATLLWSQTGTPQTGSAAPSAKKSATAETNTSKLTPEQERGLRLLQASEAEAAGLQPDMHAFVLWRVAEAYEKNEPKKEEKLSIDAFTATSAMEDPPEQDRCVSLGSAGDIKTWIQERVLSELIHKDRVGKVRELLPQGTRPVREQITSELVRYYESKKNLVEAEAVLAELGDSGGYPFGPAADLLVALGPEKSADRITIFAQALSNYEQHAGRAAFGGDDIGTFIERTWKDVPPALALEAIGKVLDAAKEQGSDSRFSMSSAKGSVVLNSGYELRLFQLLPILEHLDKDKADALLREHNEVGEQLKTYPSGMQSLRTENAGITYAVGNGGPRMAGVTAQQQIEAQIQDQVEQVLKKADTDPASALASALFLPVHGAFEGTAPRAEALVAIAEKTAKKNLSISKSALESLSAIQDQLTPDEMSGTARLPELYLALGDTEGAKKAIKILQKTAAKLYERDTDSDDPNKSFKGAWPSTDLWRKSIQQAAKISPSLAEEIISELPDPEIATFEKVAYGGALVGGSVMTAPILVADCRKKGSSYRVSF
jgi:hypothetical protein